VDIGHPGPETGEEAERSARRRVNVNSRQPTVLRALRCQTSAAWERNRPGWDQETSSWAALIGPTPGWPGRAGIAIMQPAVIPHAYPSTSRGALKDLLSGIRATGWGVPGCGCVFGLQHGRQDEVLPAVAVEPGLAAEALLAEAAGPVAADGTAVAGQHLQLNAVHAQHSEGPCRDQPRDPAAQSLAAPSGDGHADG